MSGDAGTSRGPVGGRQTRLVGPHTWEREVHKGLELLQHLLLSLCGTICGVGIKQATCKARTLPPVVSL